MTKKLFLALLAASATHAKRSRQGFQELDLSTGQPKVLYILNEQEGYSQKELAKICKVEQPTMTVLIDNMVKKDLLKREKNIVSGGKRAFCIYLTDKGKQLAQQVNEWVDYLEEVSFSGFTTEEKALLLNLLDRVTDNINQEMLNEYDE